MFYIPSRQKKFVFSLFHNLEISILINRTAKLPIYMFLENAKFPLHDEVVDKITSVLVTLSNFRMIQTNCCFCLWLSNISEMTILIFTFYRRGFYFFPLKNYKHVVYISCSCPSLFCMDNFGTAKTWAITKYGSP